MTSGNEIRLRIGDDVREVRLDPPGGGSGSTSAAIDRRPVTFREVRRNGRLVALEIGERTYPVRLARRGETAFVWCAGEVVEARREAPTAVAPRRRSESADSHGDLLAPMPGRVRRALVREGETVAKGQIVLVLEAMKMEHAIRAPLAGVVSRLDHSEGDLVDAGAVLIEIAADPRSPEGGP